MVIRQPLDTNSSIKEIRQILKNSLPAKSLFEKYRPQEYWFLRPDSVHDIHGINHETRVMILQEIISLLLIETQKISLDQEALRWSSATHDLRRTNDKFNKKHGCRSSLWVSKNLSSIISPESISTVKFINYWHATPDSKIPNLTPELAIFKDADALDRVRTNDLNPHFLRHQLSYDFLFSPAHDLFEISLQCQRAHSAPSFDCVLDAAIDIGLINK